METTEKAYKRYTILRVSGRVDAETAPSLEKQINKVFNKGQHHLVVDLGGVDYISSAGLRVLVTALKKTRRYNRGDVRLAALSIRLKEAFQLVGFNKLFQIFEEVEDAAGSF
ncbi:MAG TPA: STAS domain-containing protein [Anaerolineales bacterium]|jgi:anti-anti-sigma factor|nr:STAS domain-containing protein [Anaerolineales bacterium]